MANDVEQELREAVERILNSAAERKLVVAGPGAGKTFLFRKLLDRQTGGKANHLVLTFINNLKADLDRSLGHVSEVFTLHGYCQYLLCRRNELRDGLGADFVCYPGLVSLIKRDWEWLQEADAPSFVRLMRHLQCTPDQIKFLTGRGNYYNSVDFDDSVFRVCQAFKNDQALVPSFDLVLVDEFQDFNKMEAAIIAALAECNRIVITGDDDQALYSQLRAASWDHIRGHHNDGEYDRFYLPFCMRCTKVIIDAVNDVIRKAKIAGGLKGRINKPYRYYAPIKGADSRRYPKIDWIRTSVQRQGANYFGKYIEQFIRAIPQADIDEAVEKHEPLVLVIGNKPYLPQIGRHLVNAAMLTPKLKDELGEREEALKILATSPCSNLGWRIILGIGDQAVAKERVRRAHERGKDIVEVIPQEERETILAEAREWHAQHHDRAEDAAEANENAPRIKLTSYEGAKGLSAQYVFLVGVHAGELPARTAQIKDIEICRFLVGLTRTKKKCMILTTGRFGEKTKQSSIFLSWIDAQRYKRINVNAAFWRP